jgi:UDP-glucose 4-epimerase
MKILITGCAGFIGSSLTAHLLRQDATVIGVDSFSTGKIEFLPKESDKFILVRTNILSDSFYEMVGQVCPDWVIHLAANADVRHGLDDPVRDLHQNTIATSRVLESMRRLKSPRIIFTSTGSVYGETKTHPTPEDAPFPIQTSLYAASKLAAEALISAYCIGYGFTGVVLRLSSVLGEHYTHGHIVDFFNQLQKFPSRMHVLGDGMQRKQYVYVGDVVSAIDTIMEHRGSRTFRVFNVGGDNHVLSVYESAQLVAKSMGIRCPPITFSGGRGGWIGDIPHIELDCSRLQALGWRSSVSIEEAYGRTVTFLQGDGI